MSRLLKTSCCNHEYIGINHSPILETGYCLHCGYHPAIIKGKKLKEKVLALENALRVKSVNLRKAQEEATFIRKRIVDIYGREALKNILNHVDNDFDPSGFDARTEALKSATVSNYDTKKE